VYLYSFFNLDARWRVSGHALASLPPRKTRYALYRRLGWSQGDLEGCGKSRPHGVSNPGPPSPWRVLPGFVVYIVSYLQVFRLEIFLPA